MNKNKLFIGGLSYNCKENDLRNAFSKFGQIEDACIVLDRETQKPRGFGYVTFENSEQAADAKESMHKKVLLGKELNIDYANAKDPSRSRGGFGGGRGGFSSRGRGGPPMRGPPGRGRGMYRGGPSSRGPPSDGYRDRYDNYGKDSYGDRGYDSYENYGSKDRYDDRYPPPERERYPPPERERYPPPSRDRESSYSSDRGYGPPPDRYAAERSRGYPERPPPERSAPPAAERSYGSDRGYAPPAADRYSNSERSYPPAERSNSGGGGSYDRYPPPADRYSAGERSYSSNDRAYPASDRGYGSSAPPASSERAYSSAYPSERERPYSASDERSAGYGGGERGGYGSSSGYSTRGGRDW